MTAHEWLQHIDRQFARFPLAVLPTPLHLLERFSDRLGGPRIYMKRDDLTGLALGGDKPRKLEYLLADAKARGCDTVITCGASQSNHIRLTAAAARCAGMRPIGFTVPDKYNRNTGNLLLSRVLGTDLRIHEVPDNNHWLLHPLMEQEAHRLEREGYKPYVIPVSGSTPIGCLGYVRCAFELQLQFEQMQLRPTYIYGPCGSGGILGGLMAGMSAMARSIPVWGISVSRNREECMKNLKAWLDSQCSMLGVEPEGIYDADDRFVGERYGHLSKATREAIYLLAETEGIFTDPVYSGKSLSGLIGHIREGRLDSRDTVLFLHSGGVPALFAYADELV